MPQTNGPNHDTDAALAALRAMVAIADSTVEDHAGQLTLTQFRALRVVGERTPVTMSRVAAELGLNPSTVTRACERLTSLDLLQKAQNPLNRRETLLAPTARGRQLVERVDQRRRRVLDDVLGRLGDDVRASVVAGFTAFARAAAEGDPIPSIVAPGK
ncbi:MarR family winged helix-turn-helix transcriptional regulator [Amycolatopsis solani]|uniref:MarR family winged helix-turn-helix transcriptional regulator n=1 Tax=Amycolatopsis solani TaxID=3028615 RepID=UPI0025AF642B|nr:MarR family transcriptional regulator [Amycolatopsis sp. MEP2-6]